MSAQTDRLKRRLEAIPKAVKQAVQPGLAKAGTDLAVTMRLLAPVDTGDLRDSIHVTMPGETTPPYSQPGGSRTAARTAGSARSAASSRGAGARPSKVPLSANSIT